MSNSCEIEQISLMNTGGFVEDDAGTNAIGLTEVAAATFTVLLMLYVAIRSGS